MEEDKDLIEDEEMLVSSTTPAEGGAGIILSLKLLPLTRALHAKHGLRHGDFQRYRAYCSRRIARIRKMLKFVQCDRKRFVKKVVTPELLALVVKTPSEAAAEATHLQIPLMNCERAWAYAMQLKFELNTEPRKKYHMVNRLKKAAKFSQELEKLCMESAVVDARTKLEARSYAAWLAGLLAFETQNWAQAMASLTQAQNIYEQLCATLPEEEAALYRQRIEEIVPNLRYCAYNIGDMSARHDLLQLSRTGAGSIQSQELNELLNQTREQQASNLQDVEWRGRKMAVKQEKVRLFLHREQEFQESELQGNHDEKIAAYESLLMDCKDAIQVLRDELVEDPAFRNRQLSREGPVTSMHFLHTYLTYIKCHRTIGRNLVMADLMKKVLAGELEQEKGKKPVKPQDVARLYENVIQNLNELMQLPGLEDDLAYRQEIELEIGFYKAVRCFYIAVTFLSGQKWPESMALFHRATAYANKCKNDKALPAKFRGEVDELLALIEGRQFMALANATLEREQLSDSKQAVSMSPSEAKKHCLAERLDVYYEDPDLTKGKPNLAHFPPPFEPIPCKPLFFDLAREHLSFPALEDKMTTPGRAAGTQSASGGWLGGWLGWGSKAKK